MRVLVITFLLVPWIANAQIAPDLTELTRRYQLLEQHQSRLEARLAEQGERIARLKAQPPGVRRDFQLNGTLKENLELANKLTELRKQLYDLSAELEQRYDRLIDQAADPEERGKLQKLKQQLIAQRASGPIRIIIDERADPLDAPEDLEAKADLLQDSAEKLRRQLRQVQAQLARLEHRAKLQRHSRAMEENPFIESSPRRTGHAKRISAESSSGSTGNQVPTVTAPGPTESGTKETPQGGDQSINLNPSRSYDGTPGEAPSPDPGATPEAPGGIRHSDSSSAPPVASEGQEALILSIQEVLDPVVLRELTMSAGNSRDLKSRIVALRRAQQQLKQMSSQMGAQAHKLRRQARVRRQQQ